MARQERRRGVKAGHTYEVTGGSKRRLQLCSLNNSGAAGQRAAAAVVTTVRDPHLRTWHVTAYVAFLASTSGASVSDLIVAPLWRVASAAASLATAAAACRSTTLVQVTGNEACRGPAGNDGPEPSPRCFCRGVLGVSGAFRLGGRSIGCCLCPAFCRMVSLLLTLGMTVLKRINSCCYNGEPSSSV